MFAEKNCGLSFCVKVVERIVTFQVYLYVENVMFNLFKLPFNNSVAFFQGELGTQFTIATSQILCRTSSIVAL